MAAVTLATLRTRARERADMPVAGFIADSATGIDAFINEGVQKLWEKLIRAYGEEFVETSSTFNTVAGTSDYNLPTDLVQLYGVDIAVDQFYFALRPYNRAERNLYRNSTIGQGLWHQRKPYYKLSGMSPGKLRLLPAPDAVYTVTVWYAPSATLLVNTSDTVNFPNGWEKYVVLYAAIQMKLKEESDVNDLRVELQKIEQELDEITQRRNADQPHSVVDIELVDEDNPLRYI